jgi:hypothetical protein
MQVNSVKYFNKVIVGQAISFTLILRHAKRNRPVHLCV